MYNLGTWSIDELDSFHPIMQEDRAVCLSEKNIFLGSKGRNRRAGVKSATIVPTEARSVFRVWDSSSESCHNKVP